MVLKLTDRVESEAEELIKHAFIYGAALVLFFFLALFLTLVGYQYVSKRLKGYYQKKDVTQKETRF